MAIRPDSFISAWSGGGLIMTTMNSMLGSGTPVPGPDSEVASPAVEMTGRTRDLLDILLDGKGDAGVLYTAALRVVAEDANPVRFRLAAHALRELMDELQRTAGFTRAAPSLKARLAQLEEGWNVARQSFEVAGSRSGFAQTLDEFFVAYRADYPGQREQAAATIGKLHPVRRDAPPTVRDSLAEQWLQFRGLFNRVAHGGRTNAVEFRSRVEAFEDFLLDWFRPRTFADYEAIDALIRQGPPDA